jgi:transcriptional regulator with XRE-family HTH domain
MPSARASDNDAGTASNVVGRRLRQLRLAQGLTFRALAARSGVSASMISDTERGAKSPSISVLIALAEALGTTPSQLLIEGDVKAPRMLHVSKSDRGVVTNANGVRREHFEPAVKGSRLEFLRFTLAAGADSGDLPPHRKRGIEHAHVAAGTVEVRAAGERTIVRAGDTVVFPAGQTHGYRNAGKREAAVYVVTLFAIGGHCTRRRAPAGGWL